MNRKPNNLGDDPKDQNPNKMKGDNLAIGNDASIGNASGSEISDFDPMKDLPETEEKEHTEGSEEYKNEQPDDNGINPLPTKADSQLGVENADEDALNPYSDEMKPDRDDKINSTWMMSGRNKNI